MENEENEDLLVVMSDSDNEATDKEDNDFYVEQKIINFLENEEKQQNHKSRKSTIVFILLCLLIFLSSSLMIITFPLYLLATKQSGIDTHTKLSTLSIFATLFFVFILFLSVIYKYILRNANTNGTPDIKFVFCLPNFIKSSILLTIGSGMIFWLQDGNYIPCHLEDPLKGCAIFFSFIFYFFLCKKRMSLERIFCTITVIVGVFVTVDFGLCDRYRCYGISYTSTDLQGTKSHVGWVVLYIIAHAFWVLQFTVLESSFDTPDILTRNQRDQLTTSSFLSIISNINESHTHSVTVPDDTCKQSTSLRISLPSPQFPLTSTPLLSAHHTNLLPQSTFICCVHFMYLCVMLVVSYLHIWSTHVSNNAPVVSELLESVYTSAVCHSGLQTSVECTNVNLLSISLTVSYAVLLLSALAVMARARSSIIVVALMMCALPMANLWWSLYTITPDSNELLRFNPEITGEAVSAMLGFPIIGIGVLLMVKSHLRVYNLSVQ